MVMNDKIPRLYLIVAPFIMAFGWTWYHLSKHDPWRFVGITYLLWIGLYLGWQGFKLLYLYLVQHYHRQQFWQVQAVGFLDELFFWLALFFGVFFLRNELMSLAYVLVISAIVFFRTRHVLKKHPASEPWLKTHTAFFILGWFLFLVNSACQYAAYHYYILDANVKFFNIVAFRAVAMTALWMFAFVIALFLYSVIRQRILKIIPLLLWVALFVFFIAFWVVNTGILYYSGLYFSPAVLEHTSGAGAVAANALTLYLILGG
ncbi:MAG: hypothetical protein EXS55_04715, partial [Candidatus Magasanikbacteria bacterium]|nr:hypothetical protein [Candidatus Magasanikbacteria bacterium]